MKDKVEILNDLKGIITENFKIESDDIEMNTNLIDGDISLDSIQLIELTVSIEQFYGFEFKDDMLTEENFSNFDILTSLIKSILDDGNE